MQSQTRVYARLLILLTDESPLDLVDRLESLGARVFARKHIEAIEICVQLPTWQLKKPERHLPSFYLLYPAPESLTVFLRGRIKRIQLAYGERVDRLSEILAIDRRWFTTKQIAEAIEVAESSVKVYMSRLRAEFESKRYLAGVDVAANRVFCSSRENGAWMHRLRAQVLILD